MPASPVRLKAPVFKKDINAIMALVMQLRLCPGVHRPRLQVTLLKLVSEQHISSQVVPKKYSPVAELRMLIKCVVLATKPILGAHYDLMPAKKLEEAIAAVIKMLCVNEIPENVKKVCISFSCRWPGSTAENEQLALGSPPKITQVRQIGMRLRKLRRIRMRKNKYKRMEREHHAAIVGA